MLHCYDVCYFCVGRVMLVKHLDLNGLINWVSKKENVYSEKMSGFMTNQVYIGLAKVCINTTLCCVKF